MAVIHVGDPFQRHMASPYKALQLKTNFKVHFVHHPISPFCREEHMRRTCTKRRCSDMATMASEASLK